MRFCLFINASEHWAQSIECALSLAKCMTSNGHDISAVFFYGQAVNIIENPDQLEQWQLWQRSTKTLLMLCSTQLENYQLTAAANQCNGFEVVSLGSWVKAIETADKTVELN